MDSRLRCNWCGKPFWHLFDRCFYCGWPIFLDLLVGDIWGMSDPFPHGYVHLSCMERAADEIVHTGDWARGQLFSQTHVVFNPLAETIAGLKKAGLQVSEQMSREEPEKGRYSIVP